MNKIEIVLTKTNYDLRLFANGSNILEAWYKSNGKRLKIVNPLSPEDLYKVLCNIRTKKEFKEDIGLPNESTLYIGR